MIHKIIQKLKVYDRKNLFNLVDYIKQLNIQKSIWINYINLEDNKYNKNVIYRDDKFEIIFISWGKNAETKIHCHPKNGCIMKILEGKLIEETYNSTFDNKKLGVNYYNFNDTSYIHNSLYKHKIINGKDPSFSLHIYSPPNYYD